VADGEEGNRQHRSRDSDASGDNSRDLPCNFRNGGPMAILEPVSLTTVGWMALAVLVITVFLQSVRFIPNTRVGIVEKRFSPRGSVESGLIALNGEAGFQPAV